MAMARGTARCRGSALALGALLLAGGACAPPAAGPTSPSPTPPRVGRFGSLRDFFLIERPAGVGAEAPRGPTYYFLDRFEVTRADWHAFAATAEGRAAGADDAATSGDPALPVGRIDLAQARAFARWRFARLPRLDEWTFATIGDGRNRFPWGSKVDATRANTGELGLGEPTPVGTFESGRRADGWPYDLVGNVSEWTESVPWSWCEDPGLSEVGALPTRGEALGWQWRTVLRTPALAVWQGPGGIVPLPWAVAAGGENVPHEVVGADFLTPMPVQVESVLAGDRRLRTGLRLCTTPKELLAALLAAGGEPGPDDLEQLRRFVARSRHREVLEAAWRDLALPETAAERASGLGRWLASELGASTPMSGGG
jgi:hypothetical protein